VSQTRNTTSVSGEARVSMSNFFRRYQRSGVYKGSVAAFPKKNASTN